MSAIRHLVVARSRWLPPHLDLESCAGLREEPGEPLEYGYSSMLRESAHRYRPHPEPHFLQFGCDIHSVFADIVWSWRLVVCRGHFHGEWWYVRVQQLP